MYNSQELANAKKKAVKEQNTTVGKMLSDCGLSVNTLSSMQSGGYYPRLEAITKIADYLGVSVDYLLGRDAQHGELPDDERALLEAYREKPENVKNAVKALLEIE